MSLANVPKESDIQFDSLLFPIIIVVMKDNLVPVYKLRKGRLFQGDLVIPLSFGIVYEDNGKYYFELFIDDGFSLSNLLKENRQAILQELSLQGDLDEGGILFANKVHATNIQPDILKISTECFGRITIEKPSKSLDSIELSNDDRGSSLHFLKLEGLKMDFSDHTHVNAYRNHKEISWHLLQDYHWDHSVCHIQVEGAEYKTIWRKDDDGEIIVEFLPAEYQYLSLPFAKYESFKADFISLISFLNGATVNVRAEYTGTYFSQPKLDAQIKHIYSFKKEETRSFNNFIPLNAGWFRGDNILNRALFWDFNRYRYWNNKLDLNAIVYVLGNAQQGKSIYERVYIQMILLERLSDSYALIHPVPNPKLVDEGIFAGLKYDLEKVLSTYEDKISINHYQTLRARIFGLNDGKRQRTDVKIVSMLEDVGIEITDEIRKVISEDRHAIIHKGKIGSGLAFKVLDKLLRHIVIKLIKYNGPTVDSKPGEGGGSPVFEGWEKYRIGE